MESTSLLLTILETGDMNLYDKLVCSIEWTKDLMVSIPQAQLISNIH